MDAREIQQLLIEILYTELNEAEASAALLSKITEERACLSVSFGQKA